MSITSISYRVSHILKSHARLNRLAIHTTIEEYILDHKSQNHSPKTIEWHTLALGNLAAYLEKQGVTEVEQIERVHLLGWLNALSTQPSAKGKSSRLVRSTAMRVQCELSADGWKCKNMSRLLPQIM